MRRLWLRIRMPLAIVCLLVSHAALLENCYCVYELDIKSEKNDIPVLNDIFLAFNL